MQPTAKRKSSMNYPKQEIEGCHLYIPTNYHPIRIIGRGAFGTVVLCEDTQLLPNNGWTAPKKVAIKKILSPFHPSNTREEQLVILREYMVMQHFQNSPNIVNLISMIIPRDYNSFQDLYLVMEYFPMNLEEYWTQLKNKANTENEILSDVMNLMYQLVTGLSLIHSSGLVHRDLKPANILIDPSRKRLAICDFGMVCDSRQPMEDLYVTTRSYRAPELCFNYERCSKEVDMWSVGCIFAEMLLHANSCIAESNHCDTRCKSSEFENIGPLFKAKNSNELLHQIFETLGSHSLNDIRGKSTIVNEFMQTMSNFPSVDQARSEIQNHLLPHIKNEKIFHFLFGLLEVDLDKRLTVQQALNHDLFRQYTLKGDEMAGSENISAGSIMDLSRITQVEDVKRYLFNVVHSPQPQKRNREEQPILLSMRRSSHE